jgi:hypothetical protein
MTSRRLPALVLAALLMLALGACAGGGTSFDPRPAYRGPSDLAALTAADPYTRGKLHLEAGRVGLALHQFRLALEREPDSIAALNGIAIAYDQLGRHDLARRHFDRALARDGGNVVTLNNLGRWHLRHGRLADARAHLHRALAADPGNAVVLANLQRSGADSSPATATAPAAPAADPVTAPVPLIAPAATPSGGHEAWIERSGRGVQTLVTRPDPALVRTAREAGVDPRWLSYVAAGIPREGSFAVARRPTILPSPRRPEVEAEPPAALVSAAVRASSGWCDLLVRLPGPDAAAARAMGDAGACARPVADADPPRRGRAAGALLDAA